MQVDYDFMAKVSKDTADKNDPLNDKPESKGAEVIDNLTKELEEIRKNRVLTLLFSYDENLGDSSIGKVYLTFRSLKFEINELFIKEEFAKMYISPQAHSAV